MLKMSNLTVSDVGIGVGFDDVSHFSRAFRRVVGVPPSAFRTAVQ
jgi:AraC family transcriptional regulator